MCGSKSLCRVSSTLELLFSVYILGHLYKINTDTFCVDFPSALSSNATISSESVQATPTTSTRRVTTNLSHALDLVANQDDEEALVNQYAVEGAAAEEVLGYDEDDEEEEGDVAGHYMDGGDGSPDFDFNAFQRQVRVDEML